MSNKIPVKYIDLPLQYSHLKLDLLKRIETIFESGQFILGSECIKLEDQFAKYCNSEYAVGVGNGTDALFLVMKALGIGINDEVITAPNSFIATAGAIANTGAIPVFVDVRDDYNINPDLIEEAVTKHTKAIIPVHLTGRPADMNAIIQIAKDHGLFIIEDAAQAIGAEYFGKKVGSFGIAGCFSLHPLKNLNAGGDAGIITTSDDELYHTLIKLRNHGLRNRDECDFWGYNSRLDSLQAAIIRLKLEYLEEWTETIRKIAHRYHEKLKDVVDAPVDKKYEKSVYHLFMVQCKQRDKLQKYLLSQGIESKIHYPIPIHLQKPAKKLGYKKGDFPVAESQAQKILSLPIYPELNISQIETVIKNIKYFYSHSDKK